MSRYHDLALRPYWMKISGAVGATRSSHAKDLAGGGLGRLLGGLHLSVRWKSNVLELHGFVIDREIHLAGCGLRLVPSFFCRQAPIVLIGRTRAAILEATTDGCTTTELAKRLNISPATASHHATVLRDAGLITTIRAGSSVLHSLHPRGELLLNQQRVGGPSGGSRSASTTDVSFATPFGPE